MFLAVAAGLALASCLHASPAEAGAFSISPVRIYMTQRTRAVAVTVSNEGDDEILLEAEVYQWSQREDGADVLAATEDLVFAPPVMRIPPHAHQVVRLALLRGADPARELSYRLVLHEVNRPTPRQEDMQVPVALALSLPVFVTPSTARREVDCLSLARKGRAVEAVCRNAGTAYAQVRDAVLKRSDHEIARFAGGNYFLAGSTKALALALTLSSEEPSAGPAALTLTYDDGTQQVFELALP